MGQQADHVPTMMQYLMPIPQFTKPEEIYLEAFKPYIPMTMMATNMENMDDMIGNTSKDIGFVNADGKSLRTLHNEQFPLIKAADVDEVVKMISKDCEMVGTLCPQLRKLSVYMDHPWALGIMQFGERNMYQGLSKLSMLTQFTMTAHRWENVSGIIRVIGSKLSHIHIVVSKRNDAVIERRYNDFCSLYERILCTFHPSILGDFQFPKKVLIGNFKAEVITERTDAFHKFLNLIAVCDKLLYSDYFHAFLCSDEQNAVCLIP